SRGIADVRRGLADIGMVSRAMTEAESDLTSFALARDGVCLIVHADNPARELTDDQIVGIYTGKIENWREVGGRDAPITVVHKAAGRATLAVFLEHFGLDSGEVRADVIIGDNEHGIKTVLGNPDAIGYVSVGTAEYHAGQGAPLRLLASHGVSASARHLQDGTFPIRRVLNLVTRATPEGPATPEGQAARFIAFTRSAAVSDLVREFHFVPTSS
ncbi:MAG: substrate-binding domain-containing protein, partial [Phycisphaerae bacterium]